MVKKYPYLINNIIKWTSSDNRWLRRGAASSLIIPVSEGLFKKEAFEIASLLLFDKDDLVQKGVGWLLKTLSKNYEDDVFFYIKTRKHFMSRTILRYAIEKMPKEKRKQLMAK